MITKDKYITADKNGLLERLRGDEISRRIAKIYPLSAQIALLMDKDSKPKEWEEYQAFRAEVKAEVDAEFKEAEALYSANLDEKEESK